MVHRAVGASYDVATAGRTVAFSGLIVTVNSVSALALAASIGGTAASLLEIKAANSRLIPRLHEGLRAAQNAATLLPYITAQDIDTCVDVHRLHVHQNIDEDGVHQCQKCADD